MWAGVRWGGSGWGGDRVKTTTAHPAITEMTKIEVWERAVEIGGSTGLAVAKLLWLAQSDLGA